MRKIEAFRKKWFDFRVFYYLLWSLNTAFDSDNLALNYHNCQFLVHETRRATLASKKPCHKDKWFNLRKLWYCVGGAVKDIKIDESNKLIK